MEGVKRETKKLTLILGIIEANLILYSGPILTDCRIDEGRIIMLFSNNYEVS